MQLILANFKPILAKETSEFSDEIKAGEFTFNNLRTKYHWGRNYFETNSVM